MNTQEFFELVKKMRAAQKLYFRSRLQGDLMTAKRLEGEVDAALTRGLSVDSETVPVNWSKHLAYSQGQYAHTEGVNRYQNPYRFTGDQASAQAWFAGWAASEAEDHKFEKMEKDNE